MKPWTGFSRFSGSTRFNLVHLENPVILSNGVLVLCLLSFILAAATPELNAQTPPQPAERHHYKIDLKIDFDQLTYTGVERVRWVNRGEKPTSIIYFHLYPNLRVGDQQFPVSATA